MQVSQIACSPVSNTICSVMRMPSLSMKKRRAPGISTAKKLRWSSRRTDNAARRIFLRLVLQRGLELRRRLVPLGLVIKLDQVAVRIAASIGRPVADVAVDPADMMRGVLERRDPPLQRRSAAHAERGVHDAGSVRRGELERRALVIVPAAQIDAVAVAAGLGHAEHGSEELQRLIRFWRQNLDVAEMRQIHVGFAVRFGHIVLSTSQLPSAKA